MSISKLSPKFNSVFNKGLKSYNGSLMGAIQLVLNAHRDEQITSLKLPVSTVEFLVSVQNDKVIRQTMFDESGTQPKKYIDGKKQVIQDGKIVSVDAKVLFRNKEGKTETDTSKMKKFSVPTVLKYALKVQNAK